LGLGFVYDFMNECMEFLGAWTKEFGLKLDREMSNEIYVMSMSIYNIFEHLLFTVLPWRQESTMIG
jgi:hypothetical protein